MHPKNMYYWVVLGPTESWLEMVFDPSSYVWFSFHGTGYANKTFAGARDQESCLAYRFGLPRYVLGPFGVVGDSTWNQWVQKYLV